MAGEMVQDEPAAGVLSWYDRTRPMWIDLVGDYAGKELFLVEGDSLLRECFEDERIDFAGKYDPATAPVRIRIRIKIKTPKSPGFSKDGP
ncbi:hypothetical protein WAI453_000663 [Rhynchosporium graminicola]